MIKALKDIGAYLIGRKGGNIEIFENPNSDYVLLVILEEKDNEFKFKKVDLEEFSKNKNNKYLYKRGSSRGTDITPTSKITRVEDTFKNKFLKWFENYDDYDLSDKSKENIKKMHLALESAKNNILLELNEKFDKKKRSIITLAIEKDKDILYLGDLEIFKEILKTESRKKYYLLSSKGKSLGKNEKCFICKEVKDDVYGFAIPFGFHTFDKPGFIAGGFNPNESWKDTPVCYDCAILLEQGKNYIEENLNFEFYGFNYFLIPKLIMPGDYSEILSIIEKYKKNVKLTPEIRKQITSDENEILELIGEQNNFFNNNLLFYEKQQSAFRILLYIEGILPSRLKKLFSAKRKVEDLFEPYNQLLTEKQPKIEFNFGVLRSFFPKESQKRDYDKFFLEIVNNIFIDNYIDYNLILWAIMKQIRKQFIEDKYPINYLTLSGFLLLHYIQELGLFKNFNLKGGYKNMNEKTKFEEKDFETRVKGYFNDNEAFFNNAEKKATFLTGMLIQFLLNIQYKEKNSTPFRTKLQGFKLNEKIVKNLLVEAQNKLEEYGKNYYKDLETLISNYFVSTGGKWQITEDETSFYFVLGMNLAKNFKIKEKEEENE